MRRWSISAARRRLGRRVVVGLAVDGAIVALAWYLAFRLRFDGPVPHRYQRLLEAGLAPALVGSLASLALFGVYRKSWRYLGPRDYEALLRAAAVAVLLVVGFLAFTHPVTTTRGGTVSLPSGIVALFALLLLAGVCGARFLAHAVGDRTLRGLTARSGARSVLIVGAGDGGRLVLGEIIRKPELGLRPAGFVDDFVARGTRVAHGLKVLGTTEHLERVLEEVVPDEVLIAIPSAPGTLRARVVGACRARGIPVRTLPTVFELLSGGANVVRQVREVQVEDVLGREPVLMELDRVGVYLHDRTVMVTGAGGSIGSELCRQIARVAPRRLVLVDHAEDNLFAILRELEDERHVHGAVGVLADCKEEERMREVFTEHAPQVVFHAAAYKHVGLMEDNAVEAVRNNALSTRLLAHVAGESGVERFVLVSTDKAVAPATVMGASKALAEWAVEASGSRFPRTRYASVRFGNVLGSSGSVVPIFRRQIRAGGPVTVTDPRMTRYFMTIPEAVQLVIQAGSLDPDAEGASAALLVLDMGEPVRIVDLARDMIRLSGLEPGRDIAIEVVGPRTGEKLEEELFNPHERPRPTPAEKILRADHDPLDPEWVERTFEEVNLLVLEGDAAGLAAKVAELSAERVGTVPDDARISRPTRTARVVS